MTESVSTPPCPQCQSLNCEIVASFDDYAHKARQAQDERKKIWAYLQKCPEARFEKIIACKTCGFTRIDPMPEADVLSAFYQDYYANAQYASKEQKKILKIRKRVRALSGLVRGGTFLDVGCNLGFAVEAARLEGFKASGIEIDSHAVKMARDRFPLCSFEATTIAAYRPEQPFDLVHCSEVIEHVTDTVDFARHLARMVRPGGYLCLTTPDIGHWARPKQLVEWPEVKPPEHVSWQTKRSMTLLLEKVGFKKPRFALKWKAGMRLVAQRKEGHSH